MTIRRLLRGASILDCTGRAPYRSNVVVEGCTIASISESIDEAAGLGEVIDLDGCTLMPGLIDAHVHLAMTSMSPVEMIREPAALRSVKIAEAMKRTLRAGFTTVRDAGGGDLGMKLAVEKGLAEGPRMLISNRILSQPGGHGDIIARGIGNDGDPLEGVGVLPRICNGPEEVRDAVREQIEAGADQIKIATSPGVLSSVDRIDEAEFTVEEVSAAVDEAGRAGIPVISHAVSKAGIKVAVDAGVQCIEHGCFLDDECVDMMKKTGCALVPTLSIGRILAERGRRNGIPAARLRNGDRIMARTIEGMRIALDKGLRVGSGTDMMGPMHGRNALELACKVSAGLSPMEAILSATAVNAGILGLGDRIGTLEPGKLADLIVLEGDPLSNIEVLQDGSRIKMVFKEGSPSVDKREAGAGWTGPQTQN